VVTVLQSLCASERAIGYARKSVVTCTSDSGVAPVDGGNAASGISFFGIALLCGHTDDRVPQGREYERNNMTTTRRTALLTPTKRTGALCRSMETELRRRSRALLANVLRPEDCS
jgi:hypothetical protein